MRIYRAPLPSCLILLVTFCLIACAGTNPGRKRGQSKVMESENVKLNLDVSDIEPVWAGHSVGFCLLTHQGRQFAAYYDANRQMTVASRDVDSKAWTFTKLDSFVKWDSHNYITMAVDDDGYLHLSGNMHVVPLIYFRSIKPMDATSLQRVETMVNPDEEKRVTYPRFFRGPKDELIFRYRDGSSGNGNDFYNVYDTKSRSWHRLLDTPLISGKEDDMNGYFSTPDIGPDGYYHMVGVWRDTSDAATAHHISYARSRDLLHWETAAGKPISLPLTVKSIDVVDPVPPRAGLFSSRLAFDSRNRPVISYHKYDEKGNSQVYCARPKGDQWEIIQISNWDNYRWDFGGGGSLPETFGVGAVTRRADGRVVLSYSRPDGQSGLWELDEKTLKVIGPAPVLPNPSFLQMAALTVEHEKAFDDWHHEGLQPMSASDIGASGEAGVRYSMKWATLGKNRDRPREGTPPAPTMLRLYRVSESR